MFRTRGIPARLRRFGSLLLTVLMVGSVPAVLVPAPASAVGGDGGFLYTARWGDSLWGLAQRFGTSVAALRQANRIWDDALYPGEVLWVPTDGAAAGGWSGAWNGGVEAVTATENDVNLLARLISAEARGEPYEGQVGVGAVVLNRAKSGRFPSTIAGVIYDPWQFEPVRNGQLWLEPSATAYRAARDALAGWDPTGGALYFFNPAKAWSSYLWSRPLLAIIGSHYFFG